MALTIFEETFGTARVKYGKVSKREAQTEHLVAVTAAVQAVVDTFRDPNTGDRFIVSLSPNTEAFTMPGAKRIVVSYKPIFDKGLKVSTACTVMTGLTLHEIGHTLYTFPNQPAIKRAFGDPTERQYYGSPKQYDQLAYTMLNVGDDARLEARMSENLPVARDIFPTMLHWVALSTGMTGNRLRWLGSSMSMTDRVNFACRSIRYPWTATWSNDAATREERSWWQSWGREYIALDDRDGDGMVRLIKVALDRLRKAAPVEAPPPVDEPPGPVCGPVGPTGDEEPPEGKQPGPSQFGDDFDKDEDDEDDDESDESDEDDDEDDDEPGEGKGGDEDDEDDDEDEPQGGSKVDVPDELGGDDAEDGEDSGDDGTEAEDAPDGDDVGPDGEPKDDEPKTWPQDFDAHNLDGQVDKVNHPQDWTSQREGGLLQKVMDIDERTDKVPTGVWGTAKVEVRNIDQLRKRGY